MYIFGDALEPELATLGCFLKAGCVFVDIGANVGVYTVKAAKEVGESGTVIAVEPFIGSAHQLWNNIRANGFHNVRVRNVCAAQTTQAESFYMVRNRPNSFSLRPDAEAESISVLSVSLDDLCRWESVNRLDYLKIDAEGAEAIIIEGGRDSIGRFRPIIQVEVTLASAAAPPNYRAFSAPGSPNRVYIPAENDGAIHTAQKLGWAEEAEPRSDVTKPVG
jgi:methyltransferase, FkbM family